MELTIELSVNDYYQLREKCRPLGPSYEILERAIFRPNPFGITGDKFAVRCTLREAGELLDVARRYSLDAAINIEKAIRASL